MTREVNKKERDTNYYGFLVLLTPLHRVIICKKGIQYILQRWYSESLHGGAWRAIGYVMSKNGIKMLCVRFKLLSEAEADELLHDLPAWARNINLQSFQ
jgi:hypothetical protein